MLSLFDSSKATADVAKAVRAIYATTTTRHRIEHNDKHQWISKVLLFHVLLIPTTRT
jgi:hypothetical protein